MPRKARIINENGYQHVIVRGIGKQILFEDEKDYLYYISLLERYSEETKVGICGYCLMDNHVHLLTHDVDANISLFMKKMGVSYAGYYNRRYKRTGHLFQDRYKSQIINDENYYRMVLRYIFCNPEKAGICGAEEYRWSSYWFYGECDSFIDQELTLKLFRNKEGYRHFVMKENDDEYLDCFRFDREQGDEWAKKVLQKTLKISSGTEIQGYDRKKRDEALKKLKAKGLTIRKIERLTGINRGIIQKV